MTLSLIGLASVLLLAVAGAAAVLIASARLIGAALSPTGLPKVPRF
jgi:hypothetical protein